MTSNGGSVPKTEAEGYRIEAVHVSAQRVLSDGFAPSHEDLVERVREAHSKAMEALAADVHPYSGSAIRDWETELDAALTELHARLQAAERALEMPRKYDMLVSDWKDRAEAAEARVTELEEAGNALNDLLSSSPDLIARPEWQARVRAFRAALAKETEA